MPPGYNDLRKSKNLDEILCHAWENDDDKEERGEGYESSGIDIVKRGYNFFRDGFVVKDLRGTIQIGKWIIDTSAGSVRIHNNFKTGKEDLKIALLKPGVFNFLKSNEMHLYSGAAFSHTDEKKDPFHPVNNTWRIKAAQPESAQQIRTRLKSCIRFFVLFYDEAIETNAQVVSFTGLPSCFTWYSGGIYMQQRDKLQEKWIECFYDANDADKGYKIAGKLLQQKYTWPKGEKNWLKLNVSVLKQMENRIDSIN